LSNRDVEKAVKQANLVYTQFNELLNRPGSTDAELKRLAEDIRTIIRPIDEDLNDLAETIKVVQSNPNSFNLDKAEVETRKAFISQTRRLLQDIRSTINNPTLAKHGGEKAMRDVSLLF
jgi:hypothetical protein